MAAGAKAGGGAKDGGGKAAGAAAKDVGAAAAGGGWKDGRGEVWSVGGEDGGGGGKAAAKDGRPFQGKGGKAASVEKVCFSCIQTPQTSAETYVLMIRSDVLSRGHRLFKN